MTTPRLTISNLTKGFGSTTVLHEVSFTVAPGEVHGIIGQNGAGKSTLVKTLAGLYPDHSGRIEVDGEPVHLHGPRQARAEGIAVIYQEFSLVPAMTVAENLLLGREPGRWGYSSKTVKRRAQELIDEVGITIGADVDTPVAVLSPAVRQRIEIVKALADEVKLLVMDEPTARLSEAERVELFAVIRQLVDRGLGVIFISHYLDEVKSFTDRVTVMRNGRVVETLTSKDAAVEEMAASMLGSELMATLRTEGDENRASDKNEVIYQAENIYDGALKNISVGLRRGEVLGIAGLVGSGRTRLVRIMAGVEQPQQGTLRREGLAVKFGGPRAALDRGIALIPEDRKYQALSMESPIAENLALMALRRHLGRGGIIARRSVDKLADSLISQLNIVPADPSRVVGSLSGGNQQKVVLGKTLAAQPDVILIDQPTAGVDVGTKGQIHRLLRQRTAEGAALMVVSDDLDELYSLSDRIVVLRDGHVSWSGLANEITYAELVDLVSAGILPARG